MKISRLLPLFLFLSSNAFTQQKNLFPYQQGHKFGYCDAEGKLVIQPIFDGAMPFEFGVGMVRKAIFKDPKNFGNSDSIKTLYINSKGTLAIKDTFDYGYSFLEVLQETTPGKFKKSILAQVTKGNEHFYIDKLGRKIKNSINQLQPQKPTSFTTIVSIPYQIIYNGEKRGLQYKEKQLVPALFDYIQVIDLEHGIFVVVDNEKQAIFNINKPGDLKWYDGITKGYEHTSPGGKSEYYFMAIDSAGNTALINQDNQAKLKNNYRHITTLDDRNKTYTLTTYSNEQSLMGLYNPGDSILIEPKYQKLELTRFDKIYRVLITSENPYRYREFFINSKGVEFYHE